jgi:cytochrome c
MQRKPFDGNPVSLLTASSLLALSLSGAPVLAANPCAARNPCAPRRTMNPCAPKLKDASLVTRPKNYRPYRGNASELVALGSKLFRDTSLSTNGLSCSTCHNNHGAYQQTFAKPYPHFVQMARDRYGLKSVHLDEMVQLCMNEPMAAKSLAWDSKELAALVAYTKTQHKSFKGGMKNPCAARNPCAAKNPCSAKPVMNPCAAKNPCAARNPCAPMSH